MSIITVTEERRKLLMWALTSAPNKELNSHELQELANTIRDFGISERQPQKDRSFLSWYITSDILRYLTTQTVTQMRDELQEAVPDDAQTDPNFVTLIDILNEIIQES